MNERRKKTIRVELEKLNRWQGEKTRKESPLFSNCSSDSFPKLPSFKHLKVGLPVFSHIFHWHPYKRSPKLLKGLCSKTLSKLVIEHSEQLFLLRFLWTKAAKCYTKGTTETEEKINKHQTKTRRKNLQSK